MLKIKFQIPLYVFLLLIISPIMVLADSNDYIEVNEGDEFTYDLTVDEDVYNKYLNDANNCIGNAGLIFGNNLLEIRGFKYVVKDIGAEGDKEFLLSDNTIFTGPATEITYEVFTLINEWEEQTDLETLIFDGNDAYMVYAQLIFIEGPIIVATNVDWEDAFEWAGWYFKQMPYVENAHWTNVRYGDSPYVFFKVYWNSSYCLKEVRYSLEYGVNGVLMAYNAYYNGEKIIGKELLQGLLGINGYNHQIFMGILALTTTGIVVFVKYRSKYRMR